MAAIYHTERTISECAGTDTGWRISALLTEEEYAAARASSLTAFYTPPVLIDAIYQALAQMGLESGNLLEPACGIGNFIGMLPDSMSACKAYGVELDSISGRIARQLYQNSRIAVTGYEKGGDTGQLL